jgi:hypothetical protein
MPTTIKLACIICGSTAPDVGYTYVGGIGTIPLCAGSHFIISPKATLKAGCSRVNCIRPHVRCDRCDVREWPREEVTE